MEILLLGTAAAEGWPAPFCACDACEEARRRGGPNIRTRSGALIDDDFKIDYSADTLMQLQQCRRSLVQMRTLVFTHQHTDHVAPPELHWIHPPFSNTPPELPIELYGNKHVLSQFEHYKEAVFKRTLLEPFLPVTTATGDEILPLPADHCEDALVLRITRGGKSVFYGNDSGLYPEPTLEALAAGAPVDAVLMDCTSGGLRTSNGGHMDCYGVISMVEAFHERGIAHGKTQFIATHFSHNGLLPHEELVRLMTPHGIAVAYDGIVISV